MLNMIKNFVFSCLIAFNLTIPIFMFLTFLREKINSVFTYTDIFKQYAEEAIADLDTINIFKYHSNFITFLIMLLFLGMLENAISDKQVLIDPSIISDIIIKINSRNSVYKFLRITGLVKKTSE